MKLKEFHLFSGTRKGGFRRLMQCVSRNGIPIQKASLLGTFENLAKNDLFKDAFQSKIIPICLVSLIGQP